MDGGSYATLSEELTQSFPRDAQSFLHSAASTVISRINSTLSEVDQFSKINGVNINECWRAVVLAGPVLHEVARLSDKVSYIIFIPPSILKSLGDSSMD